MNKIFKVGCLRFSYKTINGSNGCYRYSVIVLICGIKGFYKSNQLGSDIFYGLVDAILGNMYPGEPEMSFMAKESWVKNSFGKLIFKFTIGKRKVFFHVLILLLLKDKVSTLIARFGNHTFLWDGRAVIYNG